MTLRADLASLGPETVHDLETAGRARFWDAMELAIAGRTYAAIYVGGYSAEMLLKSATFRLRGAALHQPAGAFFGPAKAYGQARFSTISHENYHSIIFWQLSIIELRKDAGLPHGGGVFVELMLNSQTIFDYWNVAMRYRDSEAHPQLHAAATLKIEDFVAALSWIDRNHQALWS